MKVPFYNFAKLHDEKLQADILKRFQEILQENSYVEGRWNQAFEDEFATKQQANHALLVANGTDALEICLQAYDIKPGDKVAIPGISFYATAECVINHGAIPVFVDIIEETGLIDPASFERIIQSHDIKAVIAVHIYGLPADIATLEKICAPKGIKIIEDSAQGQGGFYQDGKPIGSSNNLSTFSFYPTKNLGAFGDAGAITFSDNTLKQKILSIRNHGRSPDGTALVGRNSRCDHLQAAVLHYKLGDIDELNQKRKKVAAWYFEELKDLPIRLVNKSYVELSSWHLFPIGLSSKEKKYELKDFLAKNEIGSNLFYEYALPEEKPIAHLEGEKERALVFAANTLCLPMHPFISHDDVKLVAETIKQFLS